MFHHVVILPHRHGVVGQFHGEAQRSIVQYFILFIAIGHDEFSILHHRRSSASERRSHLVAVESIAMVEMVGGSNLQLFRLIRFTLFDELLNPRMV